MHRCNVLSFEHKKCYTAEEALAFFERDSENESSSLLSSSSSSSSETESDKDPIPPSPKIHKVRCTLLSNKSKNANKIPQSVIKYKSKDSGTFGTKSSEAIISEPSIPKVVSTPEKTTSNAKGVSSETSVPKKHGQFKKGSVQKSKVVSTPEKPTKSHAKGLTSETSVKIHVKQANLNSQVCKNLHKTATKVVSTPEKPTKSCAKGLTNIS